MPKKLIVRVRPGVALTCATFAPRRELIRLDLPTLERPRKAISGGPAAGNCSTAVADLMNLVATFTHSSYKAASPRSRGGAEAQRTKIKSPPRSAGLCARNGYWCVTGD